MAAAAETRTYGRPRPQCRAARPTSQPPIRVLTPKQKQSEGEREERGRGRGTNKRRCRAQPFAAQPSPAQPGRRWRCSMSSRLTTCTVSGEHPFPGAGAERSGLPVRRAWAWTWTWTWAAVSADPQRTRAPQPRDPGLETAEGRAGGRSAARRSRPQPSTLRMNGVPTLRLCSCEVCPGQE